jgi:hypothetical protein
LLEQQEGSVKYKALDGLPLTLALTAFIFLLIDAFGVGYLGIGRDEARDVKFCLIVFAIITAIAYALQRVYRRRGIATVFCAVWIVVALYNAYDLFQLQVLSRS